MESHPYHNRPQAEQTMNRPGKRTEKKLLHQLVVPALLCCALWGSAPALIKTGYAVMQIETLPSILLFAGLRFTLAGFMVLAFWSVQHCMLPLFSNEEISSAEKERKNRKPAGWLKAVCILALFQTFGQYMFYYFGAANASGIMVSVLSGASALFALMAACWLFRTEKMTGLKMAGCLLGLSGIVCMNLHGLSFSFAWNGEGFVLISQILSAFSACFISKFSRQYSAVLLSGWQFVFGGAAMVICGLVLNGSIAWNGSGLLILLWLAFVSAGAYTLWGVLLSKWPVSSVGIFGCATPVFGVLISALVLKEVPGWNTLAALLLITAGIACINLKLKSGRNAAA